MKVLTLKKCNGMPRQCSLCKFYYFINKNFNYQRYLCDWCQDISIKAIGIQNINAYRVNYMLEIKNDAFNLIKNSKIIDKKEYYKAKIK